MTRWVRALVLAATASIAWSCSDEPPRRASPVQAQPSDIDVLREQLAKDPKNADAWFHLSELYERASLYREQADALREVIALRPRMGFAYFKLGTACNRLRQYEEAVKNFTRAEKYVKNQPMLYNNLAVSYGKLGRTREEIAALRKAIAIRPRYSVAHYNLGMALLRKGDREGARKELRILEEFDEGAAASLRKEIEAASR
jgi:tetratricopeptide (TPR) repeat protein